MSSLEEIVIDRLNSMDRKLEQVTTAINTLARVEERQTHHRDDLTRAWGEIRKLDARMNEAERAIGNNGTLLGLGGKFWWPIYGAGVATAFAIIGWMIRGVVVG